MGAAKRIFFGLITLAASGAFFSAWWAAQELGQRRPPASRPMPWLAPPERTLARASVRTEPLRIHEFAAMEDVIEAEFIPAEPPAARKVARVARPEVVAAPAGPVPVEPEDAVRMALRLKRSQFEYCYQRELKKQAAFSGFVVVSLSVTSEGTVTDAHVQEGNSRDAAVGGCIVAQLRTLKLPQLTSDADLIIPIRLEAKDPS